VAMHCSKVVKPQFDTVAKLTGSMRCQLAHECYGLWVEIDGITKIHGY
jgi:hypothetical protein